MSKFTDTLKSALEKKQAATHPDQDKKSAPAQPGRGPVLANKPQKRVTGRGR